MKNLLSLMVVMLLSITTYSQSYESDRFYFEFDDEPIKSPTNISITDSIVEFQTPNQTKQFKFINFNEIGNFARHYQTSDMYMIVFDDKIIIDWGKIITIYDIKPVYTSLE